MKALKDFTNVDKAVLLHQLFRQKIPVFLVFIKGMGLQHFIIFHRYFKKFTGKTPKEYTSRSK